MKKIKVAFFADCLIENYDGAIRTMYQLIDRIDPTRFEYLFITGDGPQGPFSHDVCSVKSISLPVNSHYKVSLPFLTERSLNQQLEAFDPDIVHIATPSPLGSFALQFSKRYQIPAITIYHTHFISYVDYYLQNVAFLKNPVKNLLITKLHDFYNECDMVYVPTLKMKESLGQIGVFKNHMKIWKRGINNSLFTPDKKDKAWIQDRVGNRKANLLFASRLVWEKNLQTLVDIQKLIEERNLPYNLLIAGSGYAEQELKTKMPNAIFLGNLPQDELAKVYASADVFVFPSISETYGNVVAEAMASGLPCVIANGGGTVEFIDHGENGFICRANHAADYLEKIHILIEQADLRNQFVQHGLEQTKHMSWDALAQTYFDDILSLTQESFAQRA